MQTVAERRDLIARHVSLFLVAILTGILIATPAPAIDAGDVFRFGLGAIQQMERQRQQPPPRIQPQPQRRIETPRRAAPAPRQAQGVSRETVRDAQRLLNDLGYSAGPVDGKMGPQTRAAIRQFQMDAGIAVDGRPSPLVLSTLRASAQLVRQPAPPPQQAALERQVEFAELEGFDLPLGDYRTGISDPALADISLDQCKAECAFDEECRSFTYNTDRRICLLKSTVPAPSPVAGAISGIKADEPAALARAPIDAHPAAPAGTTVSAVQPAGDPPAFGESLRGEDRRAASTIGQANSSRTQQQGRLVAPALAPAPIETTNIASTQDAAATPLQGLSPAAPEGASIGMTVPEIEAALAAAGYKEAGNRSWELSPEDGTVRISFNHELCSAESDCPSPLVTQINYSQSGLFVPGTAVDVMERMREVIGAEPSCRHVQDTWGDCTWISPPGVPLVKSIRISYQVKDSEFDLRLDGIDNLRSAVAEDGWPTREQAAIGTERASPEVSSSGAASGDGVSVDADASTARGRPDLVAPAPAGAPLEMSGTTDGGLDGEPTPRAAEPLADGTGAGAKFDYEDPLSTGVIPLIGMPMGEVEAGLVAAGYEKSSAYKWISNVAEGTRTFSLFAGSCSSNAEECADRPIHQLMFEQRKIEVPESPIEFVRRMQTSLGEPQRCDKLDKHWAYCRWVKPPGAPGIALIRLDYLGDYLTLTIDADPQAEPQRKSSVQQPISPAPVETAGGTAAEPVRADDGGQLDEVSEAAAEPPDQHWWDRDLARAEAEAQDTTFARGELYEALPPDIRARLRRESRTVHNTCKGRALFASLHDCRCVADAFVEERINRSKATGWQDMSKTSLIGMAGDVAGQCPNKPGAAEHGYRQCLRLYKRRMPDGYEAFCTCYADTFADAYMNDPRGSDANLVKTGSFSALECSRRGLGSL